MSDAHRGARVGTRVATVVSRAIVATHTKLLASKHKLAMLIFRAISDEISEEVDHTLGPILRDMSERYPDDGPAAALLTFMAEDHGQLKALVGQGLAQQGLLWPLSQILNNLLAGGVYDALRATPNSLPDAATIAQTAAQGTTDYGQAINDIAAWGFNAGWGDSLIAAAQAWPSSAQVLDMMNRNLIDPQAARTLLKRTGLPDEVINNVLATAIQPLPPADAALAVLRGTLTHDEGSSIAQESGITPDTFNTLIDNTGEPLGLMQLLEAYRRGFIDQATLKRGILQSRVRDEWIDTAEKLRYSPMSVSDAVNAVVQNHMGEDAGKSIADQNGLEPGAFDMLYQTAGEPLSRTECEQLYNRGLMTQTELEQALRESRLKNKYVSQAFELHTKLLEPRVLSESVTAGAVTHGDAIKLAMEAGYTEANATILVGMGSLNKLKTYRDRVVSAVETMYEDSAISQDQAVTVVKAMGYTDQEASFIFEAADLHRQSKVVGSAISVIRSKYLGRHITQSEASGSLDALGVPSAQRDYLLNAWSVEWSAETRQLTEAQIVKAVKLQLITADDGQTRLMNMGYNQTDADLLLEGA
jgi:hypothetical protein